MAAALQFKPKKKAELSGFRDLVDERVAVERELRHLENPKHWRLSAKAFLREQLAAARASEGELSKLRTAIESSEGLQATKSTLRRMVSFIRSPNCGRATGDIGRLKFLLAEEATTDTELLSVRGGRLLLFALAVQIAGEQAADSFGLAESSRDVDTRLVELRLRRDELDAQIATAWSPDDVQFVAHDSQGNGKQYFKATLGKKAPAVAVEPRDTAGSRLASWLINESPA